MGFFKKRGEKLPRIGVIKNTIHRVEYAYGDEMFEFVNIILESEQMMLGHIAEFNLHLDEGARKDFMKLLDSRIIPELEYSLLHLKQLSGTGMRLANGLYNVNSQAKTFAEVLRNLCKTGNFAAAGYPTKRALFDRYDELIKDHLKRIEAAYREGCTPDVLNELLDHLRHVYINDFEDWMGKRRMDVYHETG